ncbi:unnamed protein product [Spirodela intermedia]|uniref:Uncharacterized protein n=1 Tax=Spirodela intermedia TaxID=51605 RepID=A0A7I8IBF7_SPIIN|nr:unnamed protein product [Spirodela intermedia]CAA6654211.1 unnamed protein product [Spirodela intermedia]
MGSPLPLSPARLSISRPPPPALAPAASPVVTALPASAPTAALPFLSHSWRRRGGLSDPAAAPGVFTSLRPVGNPRKNHSPLETSSSLRVPEAWLAPPKALEESEWLRVALHKWLDDEFCPEEMNVEISRVAAQSYQESLLARNPDMGDILLKMATDLLSLSYQESFHGAFSAANAAVRLITERVESCS